METNAGSQKNHPLLARLAREDQKDRIHYVGNEQKVTLRDAKRREKVKVLLRTRQLKTARDFFNAALIFQHGVDIGDYKQAKELARQAMKKGEEDAKWLYAAATDRLLIHSGKKQKFGTQYYTHVLENDLNIKVCTIKISPFDKRTSDKLRARYNVPPLKKLLAQENVLTRRFFKKTN